MVLDRGELVAVVDQKTGAKRRFVARNIHLLQAMSAEDVCRLIDAIAGFLRNCGLYDVLEVRGIEDLSAGSDSLEEVFVQRGFEVDLFPCENDPKWLNWNGTHNPGSICLAIPKIS